MDSVCGAYLWSLQTEYWADRFAKCLKMFHLTYFLTIIIRFWQFSSAAFIEKNAERVPMASPTNNSRSARYDRRTDGPF